MLWRLTIQNIDLWLLLSEVRDARADLDSVAKEPASLKMILELLSEESVTFNGLGRAVLIQQISGILENCGVVLRDIQKSLEAHTGDCVRKRVEWSLSGREDTRKLRSSLEVHKSGLNIALQMIDL